MDPFESLRRLVPPEATAVQVGAEEFRGIVRQVHDLKTELRSLAEYRHRQEGFLNGHGQAGFNVCGHELCVLYRRMTDD